MQRDAQWLLPLKKKPTQKPQPCQLECAAVFRSSGGPFTSLLQVVFLAHMHSTNRTLLLSAGSLTLIRLSSHQNLQSETVLFVSMFGEEEPKRWNRHDEQRAGGDAGVGLRGTFLIQSSHSSLAEGFFFLWDCGGSVITAVFLAVNMTRVCLASLNL